MFMVSVTVPPEQVKEVVWRLLLPRGVKDFYNMHVCMYVCVAGAVNAIDAQQLRADLINSGLTRWRMVV